jgi:Fe-S-cluster containining protein
MLADIDAGFDRVRTEHPGVLPCARGCSACCVSFFAITALDVWRLRRGLGQLDAEVRAAIVERAREVVKLAESRLEGWRAPWDSREIGEERFRDLARDVVNPCPALGPNGECQVYDARLRICRLQGLSYVGPSGSAALPDFCAESFENPDYAALLPQTLDLARQSATESELRMEIARELPDGITPGYRTFVAAAIVVAGG